LDKVASPRSTTAFEWLARGLVVGILLGLLVFILARRWQSQSGWVELHAVMSESGGWTPGDLTAQVGVPLRLRLVAGDVMHGFAVGQKDWPAIDMPPGVPVETELVFDQPGKYTFYCTRWCGLNHWRMRGVIEVAGETGQPAAPPARPLYVTLGLDLDAPHPAYNPPARRPDAGQGEKMAVRLPVGVTSPEYYRTHSPDQAWIDLRNEPGLSSLDDDQLWDLVADLWRKNTTSKALQEGAQLYAANCAACHGELGAGDGVMAEALAAAGVPSQAAQSGSTSGMGHSGMSPETPSINGHTTTQPANFTDPVKLLGASPALLHGKIIRGGMGTGMPYWGPIFTDQQVWSLVAYLWTFQFDYP
jgi:mono/diheme cytochrome c family protein/plastocyanin